MLSRWLLFIIWGFHLICQSVPAVAGNESGILRFSRNFTHAEDAEYSTSRKLASKPRGSGFWYVKKDKFYDANGNRVFFSGVTLSGFETDGCVHGLWARNYVDMLKQVKSLGFNLIRISFAGETLSERTYPKNNVIDFNLNPDLRGVNSVNILSKIIWTARSLGLKIILDYHRIRQSTGPEWGLWYDSQYPESLWISNWVKLASTYSYMSAVIGIDIFNEVHNNQRFPNDPVWAVDYYRPEYNYRRAVSRAVDAIQKVNPNVIIFIGGMWQNTWWGGNLIDIDRFPIQAKYPQKIAYSIHEYGPVVYDQPWLKGPNFPQNLPSQWDKYFGFVIKKQSKPVWVGEFGSFFFRATNSTFERELKWLYKWRDYVRKNQLSWTWFHWGPNSRDTGGILKDDWKSVHYNKINYLKPIMHPNFGPSPGQ